MKMNNSRYIQILRGQRGAVAILTAFLFIVFLGFAAFAVDLAYAYFVKNQLQNAADAAALAGASVLFNNAGEVQQTSVAATASNITAKNLTSGSTLPSSITLVTDIGHYAFVTKTASALLGKFTSTSDYTQMTDWETHPFSYLNDCDGTTQPYFFINAVRATVTRNDVPRFFSRIWSSSNLTVSVQAVAYIGFAGTVPPGTVDAPIAICKQSIITDPDCETNCTFTCVNGRMINSSLGSDLYNTGGWTSFAQPCDGAANPRTVPSDCSSISPALIFGQGMSTVGGQQIPVWNSVENCWLKKCASSTVSRPKDCTKPWKITLPVIDCDRSNPGPCSKLVGVVEVHFVWMWGNDPNTANGPTEMTARDSEGNIVKQWSVAADADPASGDNCGIKTACKNKNDRSDCKENCRWNSFVKKFGFLKTDGNPAIVGEATNTFPDGSKPLTPGELSTTMFFLPDCTPKYPTGGTGGDNYGILAKYPVLVAAENENPQ